MPGFLDRLGTRPLLGIGEGIRKISALGMKYDDMVIRHSRAIGPTEATLGEYAPKDLAYAFALADVSQKKYTAIFDKDYPSRRDYLRKFALNSEIDFMITTLADEAIVYDDKNFFAYPSVANLDISDEIRDAISDEYKKLYSKHGFINDITAWQYFRQFLVDGVLAFEIVFDDRGENIIGFKELDAAFLKPDVIQENGVMKKIWQLYPDRPAMTRVLYDTQVIYISYAKGNLPSRISYVENLVRSFNLLRLIENAMVMWTMMNSTWRVKMIVPIGSKSPQKAKETLAELMAIYKEDIILDSNDGSLRINGSPSVGQFYKNYLFPSKNGEQIDISTMGGDGPDLQNNPLLLYWINKLREDSKIPFARFDKANSGGQLTGSAATGVDREEIRFFKFVNRIRSAYQELIIKPLWIQMCLKYKHLEDDEIFRSALGLRFIKDNQFEEIRNQEIMAKRLEFIGSMSGLQGADGTPFFSMRWLIQEYLHLDKDALEANERMKQEDLAAAGGQSAQSAGGLEMSIPETPSPTTTETPTPETGGGGGGTEAPETPEPAIEETPTPTV